MSNKKKPKYKAEQSEIANFRRIKKLCETTYEELQEVESKWLELDIERQRLIQRLVELRNNLKDKCIHPSQSLMHVKDDIYKCKICETTIRFITSDDK